MTLRIGTVAIAAGLLLSLVASESQAADLEALVQQLTALNKAAVAAYSDGDFPKAKKQLMQAIALGKKDPELLTHPLMARTYLHLGVLFVDGFEDRKAGVKNFVKAIQIRSDIEVTEVLATKTVKAAFEEASAQVGASGETAAVPALAMPDTSGASEKPPKEDKASRAAAAREEKAAREAAAKEEKEAAKTAAAEKKRADAESKQQEKQSQAEKDKLMKELAQAGGNEAKERAAREKLQTQHAEKEALLADAKALLQQVQKDSKEAEKQALAEKDKLVKELAQVRDSEAKERAAKEKLQGEKAEKEKLLAEAKAAILQLQKEKAEKEKLLADTGGREKKEREAKEKLEKEKQASDAREKERKAQADSEKAEKDKLAAGPELPSHFSQAIYCAVPDEAEAGAELYVHCAAQPNVKAKEISFYYRPSGGIAYNAVALELSKKGWHAAVIPSSKVTGKSLQYYVEARNDRGAVAAANGKANSPNIMTLKPATGRGRKSK